MLILPTDGSLDKLKDTGRRAKPGPQLKGG
jgi:hypothetical protein